PASGGGSADAGTGGRPPLAPEGGPGNLRPRRRRLSRLRLHQVRRSRASPRPPVAPLRGGALVGRRPRIPGRPSVLACPSLADPLDPPLQRRGLCQLDGSPPPLLERRRDRGADP